MDPCHALMRKTHDALAGPARPQKNPALRGFAAVRRALLQVRGGRASSAVHRSDVPNARATLLGFGKVLVSWRSYRSSSAASAPFGLQGRPMATSTWHLRVALVFAASRHSSLDIAPRNHSPRQTTLKTVVSSRRASSLFEPPCDVTSTSM
jgi:hypothetical protein